MTAHHRGVPADTAGRRPCTIVMPSSASSLSWWITVPETTGGWLDPLHGTFAGAFCLWGADVGSVPAHGLEGGDRHGARAGLRRVLRRSLGGEAITARMLVGGSLVVAAMYVIAAATPKTAGTAEEDPLTEARFLRPVTTDF